MMKDKYKTLIYSSWAVLIFYCVVKVIFGTDFSLSSSSENFVTICTYIDNHIAIKIALSCVVTLIQGFLLICAITKQKYIKLSNFIIVIILIIIKCISQWYFNWLGVILELVILILIPIIINNKNKVQIKNNVLRVILGNGLLILFQMFSMFLSAISYIDIDSLSTLEALIYNLELYFLVFLYYLYATKGE